MKSMVLKSVLASALLVCVPAAQAAPPYLVWKDNCCWLEAAVQLLYNIREFVELILDPVKEKALRDKLDESGPALTKAELEEFAKLVRAIRAKPDAQHSVADLYGAAVVAKRTEKVGKFSDPHEIVLPFFGAIILRDNLWDSLLARVLQVGARERATLEWGKKIPSDKKERDKFIMLDLEPFGRLFEADCLKPLGEQLNDVTVDYLGKYFGVFYPEDPGLGGQKGLEKNRAAPVPLKLVIDGHEFELIIVLVAQVGYHHWAYIKDQWEKDPSWWLCYGLNHKPEPIASKEIEAKINAEWDSSKKVARYLVYKLVEPPLKTALKNFSASLSALTGQLVPKK